MPSVDYFWKVATVASVKNSGNCQLLQNQGNFHTPAHYSMSVVMCWQVKNTIIKIM
jgi:hypothetical protein